MPLNILGQGRKIARLPLFVSAPSELRTLTFTPKNGKAQLPGLHEVTPGNGVSMIAPVSVYHQVSTMGQCSLPITV